MRAPTLVAELALAAGVMLFAVVTTPQARFSSFTNGDEPKYIRLMENWWQGHGLQIDDVKEVRALPAGEGSHLLSNLALLAGALRDDLGPVSGEATVEALDTHVIRGRNGSHYQIHPAGLSLLLLPAYAIDRAWFDRGSSRFSDDLFTVNLALLLIYGCVAVAAFRMVTSAAGHTGVAALSVIMLMMSLPIAAFAFQFYPETAAGLIVCAVTGRLLASSRPLGSREAIAIGFSLGFIGWLHIRFLAMSAVALTWLVWTFRHDRRSLAIMFVPFAIVIATMSWYAYHLTGHVVPSAPFAIGIGSGFVWERVPLGLMAMLMDRDYGILAIAPVYVLAIPGLLLLARSRLRDAALVSSLALALIVPSAGQGYWTDGTVPLRHALAVLPLLALPLAAWLLANGTRPPGAVLTVLLFAVSIYAAAAYNLANDKTITTLAEAGVTRWDPIGLPVASRIRFTPISPDAWAMFRVLAVVSIICVWSSIRPTLRSRSESSRAPRLATAASGSPDSPRTATD
jgi:hypothetical protein